MNDAKSMWVRGSELVDDISIGEWASSTQTQDLRRVDFQVPLGFEAYCRVFHRVQNSEEDKPWRYFARAAGIPMRPDIHWSEIEHLLGDPTGIASPEGSMDGASFLHFLLAARRQTTADTDLAAGFWEGVQPFSGIRTPKIRLGLRNWVLFRIGLNELMNAVENSNPDLPGVLWPSNRSWYMSTDVDYNSTIIGGSRALIDDLLAHEEVEALEVSLDMDLTRP